MHAEPSGAHSSFSVHARAQHFLPPPTTSAHAAVEQPASSVQACPGGLTQRPFSSLCPAGHTQPPLASQTRPLAAQLASQQRLTLPLSTRHCPGAAHCWLEPQGEPTGRRALQVKVSALQPLPQALAAVGSHCTQRCPSLLHDVPAPQLVAQQS